MLISPVSQQGVLACAYYHPNSHTASGWGITSALQSPNSSRINSCESENDCVDIQLAGKSPVVYGIDTIILPTTAPDKRPTGLRANCVSFAKMVTKKSGFVCGKPQKPPVLLFIPTESYSQRLLR